MSKSPIEWRTEDGGKMNEKYRYDKESDSLYIHLKEGKEDRFEEIVPGINIEFNQNNEMIGIEILKASRFTENFSPASK